MVAEHLRVAVAGAVFVFAVDFADRRVDIDHQRRLAGAGAQCPRPGEGVADDGFELADVTEREGPQERAQRRRCHHPMAEPPAVEPARSTSA